MGYPRDGPAKTVKKVFWNKDTDTYMNACFPPNGGGCGGGNSWRMQLIWLAFVFFISAI